MEYAFAALFLSISGVAALDNGAGLRPPMGWRDWNSMQGGVTQAKMQLAMDALTERKLVAIGRPGLTSYADLGYIHVGLDDAWQKCGAGVNGSFHDQDGFPLVDDDKFPNLTAMVSHGSLRGLAVGWYLNNCMCNEKPKLSNLSFVDLTMRRTVEALVAFNFSGVKLDGCGPSNNLTRWAELFNSTGRPVLVENCHWGSTHPQGQPPFSSNVGVGPDDDGRCVGLQMPSECPYNFYRSSGDIINSFERVYSNVHSLVKFLGTPPLSRPGAWAHPDGLEVGRLSGPYATAEDRTHFGWYVITSSPLILGHNVSDDELNNRLWDVLSNVEAININQDWVGSPGRLVKQWGPGGQLSPQWPTGRSAFNASCDSSDDTQLGWSYNPDTRELRQQFKKQAPRCLDTRSDNNQLWVVACDGKKPQQWQWGATSTAGNSSGKYSILQSMAHLPHLNNVSIPGAQNSVGFARANSKHQTFLRINKQTGQLESMPDEKTGQISCICVRAINPIARASTYELWSKPLSGGKVAVLLVNNGMLGTLAFNISEVIGSGVAVRVRNIWNRTNDGTIAAGGRYSTMLGVHESTLLVLDPSAEMII